MPWVKLTDDWYDDPAIAAAGALGVSMWVVGLSWCARNLTDGHIPRSQARKLVDLEDISVDGAKCRADDIADHLVELGLWTRTDTGYLIANYHRYQPARAKVLADREKDRKRKSSRIGDLLADDSTDEPDPAGDFQTDSVGKPDAPVPGPVPVDPGSHHPGNSRGTSPPADDDEHQQQPAVPDEVWDRVAQLKLDQQKPGTIRDPSAWKSKAAANARIEHGRQAAEWLAMFDVRPHDLAAWLVDGKPSPYAKRRDDAA